MATVQVTRRSVLGGIGLFLAAPAIVRCTSLMKIKPLSPDFDLSQLEYMWTDWQIHPDVIYVNEQVLELGWGLSPFSMQKQTR